MPGRLAVADIIAFAVILGSYLAYLAIASPPHRHLAWLPHLSRQRHWPRQHHQPLLPRPLGPPRFVISRWCCPGSTKRLITNWLRG